MSALDNAIIWLILGLYFFYGAFSLYSGYRILAKLNFVFVNGFDEQYNRNIKNKKKFARDYSMPHILIGLNCIIGTVASAIFGIPAMVISVVVTIALFFYATHITRRLPERVRRGRYM